MIRRFSVLTLAAVFALTAPAFAALNVGDTAPTFKAQASLGGTVSEFDLAAALKKGPVVLYFYPAAFTPGCTVEAHDFADAIGKYAALGATVIGISHDTIETLNKFSVTECRSKFSVAADPTLSVAKSYDAILAKHPKYANRTSYVISKDGKIAYTYTSLNPDKHVANTLEALTDLKAHEKP